MKRTALILAGAALAAWALLRPRQASASSSSSPWWERELTLTPYPGVKYPDQAVGPPAPATLSLGDRILEAAGKVVDAVGSALIPRGLRNNNPGNIRRTATAWKGMAEVQTDPDYIQFTEPRWGVRAMGRVLRSYARRDLDTVQEIISTWAPHADNNPTGAYVVYVATALAVGADDRLDVEARMVDLVDAMIRFENGGQQPYTRAQLAEWVNIP